MSKIRRILSLTFIMSSLPLFTLFAQRQLEALNRGIVAVNLGKTNVYISWRLFGTDPDNIAFNIYCSTDGNAPLRVNLTPITNSTDYIDTNVTISKPNTYTIKAIINEKEIDTSGSYKLNANPPPVNYLSIKLQSPQGYSPNDGSVGDLDGDGEYELVIHQVGIGRDNSQSGLTTEPIIEAYKLDGTFLWRIKLGKNIREGAHYTQFIVYDLDGDGKAEIACKTADGTIDGKGKVIGNLNADWRNKDGKILSGPEYLTVFDGLTGAAIFTTNYIPPRGNVADWGDAYGNRVDRFLAAVAYLDGIHPSLIMCRGYYTRTVIAAFDFVDKKLKSRWVFDTDSKYSSYCGQGNHSISIGDVDGDSKDEIVYGACTIDDNGNGLYSTGLGHGDALHLSDIDPDRPGLEVFSIHERPTHPYGVSFYDAATGKIIWGKKSSDVGRGLAADIDPRYKGYEMWAYGEGLTGLWNVKGETISPQRPRSCNFAVWWDGDLLRELLDRTYISKWNWQNSTETRLLTADGCASNNGTKSNPVLCADILGDWREEVIWRTIDNKELRIYTTTIPSQHRIYTLMHDPQYRLSVATQNVGYNQPTQPGFYLGEGMKTPPRPNITTNRINITSK